jgi:hypothetical protein
MEKSSTYPILPSSLVIVANSQRRTRQVVIYYVSFRASLDIMHYSVLELQRHHLTDSCSLNIVSE